SPDLSSKQAASDPNYPLNCEEPLITAQLCGGCLQDQGRELERRGLATASVQVRP
ncbi:MAG: hypothetical protein Q605_AUC00473G0002, partial [Actinomyces urogenitalis DORA_12]